MKRESNCLIVPILADYGSGRSHSIDPSLLDLPPMPAKTATAAIQ